MGFGYGLALGAALALSPATAFAQDNGGLPRSPGALQGFQLDPARDTGKPKPPEREGPEIDNRLPAPVQAPAQTPAPPQSVPVAAPPPVAATVTVPADRAPASSGVESRVAQTPAPVAQSLPSGPQGEEAAASTLPPTGPVAAPAPEPVAEPVTPAAPAGAPLPQWAAWIAGALVLAGAAFWLLRRRRPVLEREDEALPLSFAALPPPAAPEEAGPETRMPPAPPAPQLPMPRAALSLEFTPSGARNTLIGAAVGYRLILRNTGDATARDVAVAALIANADARQEQALAGFFAAPVDGPAHHAATIAPGEAVEFTGELRLAHDAIVPIQVQDRALLIPLVAFSAHYGWDDGGRGYSAAAFIVGQESDPPRDRMAPFRLDQGPKQYRSVGSRQARTALVT